MIDPRVWKRLVQAGSDDAAGHVYDGYEWDFADRASSIQGELENANLLRAPVEQRQQRQQRQQSQQPQQTPPNLSEMLRAIKNYRGYGLGS